MAQAIVRNGVAVPPARVAVPRSVGTAAGRGYAAPPAQPSIVVFNEHSIVKVVAACACRIMEDKPNGITKVALVTAIEDELKTLCKPFTLKEGIYQVFETCFIVISTCVSPVKYRLREDVGNLCQMLDLLCSLREANTARIPKRTGVFPFGVLNVSECATWFGTLVHDTGGPVYTVLTSGQLPFTCQCDVRKLIKVFDWLDRILVRHARLRNGLFRRSRMSMQIMEERVGKTLTRIYSWLLEVRRSIYHGWDMRSVPAVNHPLIRNIKDVLRFADLLREVFDLAERRKKWDAFAPKMPAPVVAPTPPPAPEPEPEESTPTKKKKKRDVGMRDTGRNVTHNRNAGGGSAAPPAQRQRTA